MKLRYGGGEVIWNRDGNSLQYTSIVEVENPRGTYYRFVSFVTFHEKLACWIGHVSLNGDCIAVLQHKERQESVDACISAMNRAIDIRHPI